MFGICNCRVAIAVQMSARPVPDWLSERVCGWYHVGVYDGGAVPVELIYRFVEALLLMGAVCRRPRLDLGTTRASTCETERYETTRAGCDVYGLPSAVAGCHCGYCLMHPPHTLNLGIGQRDPLSVARRFAVSGQPSFTLSRNVGCVLPQLLGHAGYLDVCSLAFRPPFVVTTEHLDCNGFVGPCYYSVPC